MDGMLRKAKKDAATRFIEDMFKNELGEYLLIRRDGEQIMVLRHGCAIELIGILTYVANQLSLETHGISEIIDGVTIQ